MLEVNEICERLLARPGPPPASPEQMLGLAQRDRRRRRSVAATSGVLLVTASMFTTFWAFTPVQPPAAPSTISISTSPSPERRFRLGDSPMNERMIAALEAALPPGTAVTHYSGGKSEDNSPGTDTSWDVSISFGRTEYISVEVFRRRHMPIDPKHRADPCRIELMKTLHWKQAKQCEVITVGQQRIGVGVVDNDGDIWFALRHHGDWTIMLTQRGRRVLSTAEMATLVSNAAFQPV